MLLPVAWTKGTEFSRAPRHPARDITYFDRFGLTTRSGPGETLRFADGPGVVAETEDGNYDRCHGDVTTGGAADIVRQAVDVAVVEVDRKSVV